MSEWRKAIDVLEETINECQFTVQVNADHKDTGEPLFIMVGCHVDNEDEALKCLVTGAKAVLKMFGEEQT